MSSVCRALAFLSTLSASALLFFPLPFSLELLTWTGLSYLTKEGTGGIIVSSYAGSQLEVGEKSITSKARGKRHNLNRPKPARGHTKQPRHQQRPGFELNCQRF